MRRYLVVGNQTLGGAHLVTKVTECLAAGPCRFHLLVPATPPRLMVPPRQGDARAVAQDRLDRALERFAALGADVSGEVGHQSVILAVTNVLRRERFDEIVVSTLAEGASRWLQLDVPGRLATTFATPVTYLVATADVDT